MHRIWIKLRDRNEICAPVQDNLTPENVFFQPELCITLWGLPNIKDPFGPWKSKSVELLSLSLMDQYCNGTSLTMKWDHMTRDREAEVMETNLETANYQGHILTFLLWEMICLSHFPRWIVLNKLSFTNKSEQELSFTK